MVNLKNINFMSEERFESLTEKREDELYAVEADGLLKDKSSWLSGLGMPSERYDVLTLGTSNTEYTAPANGYYNAVLQVESDQHAFIELINLTSESFSKNIEKERGVARIEIGCRKGDVIKIQWSKIAQNDINRFRFYYAEGEK